MPSTDDILNFVLQANALKEQLAADPPTGTLKLILEQFKGHPAIKAIFPPAEEVSIPSVWVPTYQPLDSSVSIATSEKEKKFWMLFDGGDAQQ